MSEKVYLRPEDVWVFFCKNKSRLEREMIEVASSACKEYTVYLTMDESLHPRFFVYEYGNDEDPIHEEWCVNETDAENTALRLYREYVFLDLVSSSSNEEDSEHESVDDEIYQREDELKLAMLDFLSCVLQEKNGDKIITEYGEAFVSEVLDHVLEYISYDHCIPIFRPMFVEDPETGDEVFEEFPYVDISDHDELQIDEDSPY